MEELISNERNKIAFINSPYDYFVHLKRKKSFSRIQKKDLLLFPQLCSICGNNIIFNYIGIGRPSLFLFTDIGYVPYCQHHYNVVAAKQKYITSTLWAILISLFVLMIIGILIFGAEATRALKGFLYLFSLPSIVLIRYVANKRYLIEMGINDKSDRLFLPVIPKNAFLYFGFSFILITIGYYFDNPSLYVAAVLILVITFFREQLKTQTQVEKIVETDQKTKLGGVQIVAFDIGFYTLGFVNQEMFLNFKSLNNEKILYYETRSEILRKQL